jgi:hypothetical protein
MDSTSNLLYVGDNANDKQYRLILSFNTASLPDNAGIYSVILKLKLQGMAGTNPFITLGNLVLDVKKGSFNGNPVLQVTDFQAAASKSNVGQIFDLPDNGWYSKVWTSGVNQYINKTGVTQFRLRFPLDDDNDNIADYLKFYSGSANTSYRPQLIVKYYLP